MNRFEAALRKLRRRGAGIPESVEITRLKSEIERLRAEVDELRTDSRRIAELYDLVFERLADPSTKPGRPGGRGTKSPPKAE
ncbi:DUF6752 domain-containing protein [Agromyces lapidis]|uniref:DUF6752 domain-containing protein n=1 Tax=Agromyces lapidis TaxID=279574 RepID=A0ABV5SR88_9MICO|nr:DUF6752 domain-containing protein [Agromyces lapidis]